MRRVVLICADESRSNVHPERKQRIGVDRSQPVAVQEVGDATKTSWSRHAEERIPASALERPDVAVILASRHQPASRRPRARRDTFVRSVRQERATNVGDDYGLLLLPSFFQTVLNLAYRGAGGLASRSAQCAAPAPQDAGELKCIYGRESVTRECRWSSLVVFSRFRHRIRRRTSPVQGIVETAAMGSGLQK